MSRRDYVAIAAAIADLERDLAEGYWESCGPELMLSLVVDGLSSVFAADNERFDRDRFELAALPIMRAARAGRPRDEHVTRNPEGARPTPSPELE